MKLTEIISGPKAMEPNGEDRENLSAQRKTRKRKRNPNQAVKEEPEYDVANERCGNANGSGRLDNSNLSALEGTC